MGLFKTLCLGDVSELIFEKISTNTFRIYVQPKKEAVPAIATLKTFEAWLKACGKIR